MPLAARLMTEPAHDLKLTCSPDFGEGAGFGDCQDFNTREEYLERIKQEIDTGDYESEIRVQIATDRLLEDLIDSSSLTSSTSSLK